MYRAHRQEVERGQAGYELELWMENMVQLGNSTTKFRLTAYFSVLLSCMEKAHTD